MGCGTDSDSGQERSYWQIDGGRRLRPNTDHRSDASHTNGLPPRRHGTGSRVCPARIRASPECRLRLQSGSVPNELVWSHQTLRCIDQPEGEDCEHSSSHGLCANLSRWAMDLVHHSGYREYPLRRDGFTTGADGWQGTANPLLCNDCWDEYWDPQHRVV